MSLQGSSTGTGGGVASSLGNSLGNYPGPAPTPTWPQPSLPFPPPPLSIPGDYIIRPARNGYVLIRANDYGARVDTWVVEGGAEELAKQISAIEAEDAMRRNNPSDYTVSLVR